MGASLDSPLPEGVFGFDLESYGKNDGPGRTGLGVNIPGFIWSTPWSFFNSKIEFLAVFPFAHVDGGGLNSVGAATQAYGPIIAHDFGNGWTGGVSAFIRTPDPTNTNVAGGPGAYLGHNVPAGDFRESLQWTGSWGGMTGLTINENGYYNSDFHNSADPFTNDLLGGDFSIQKTWGKVSVGFTGYGFTALDNRVFAGGRASAVELGGLVAYDFGRVIVQGVVTRSVLEEINGINFPAAYETRGQLKLVVPLYVAPPAAAVVARY